MICKRRSTQGQVNPTHPLDLLAQLTRRHDADSLAHEDILDALQLVVSLRRVLVYLELRLLNRGHHWRGWLRQADIGRKLGVSVSGVTNRRKRLPLKLVNGSDVQIRPTTPRIDPETAAALASEVLDRREETQDEVGRLPAHDDLISVLFYVLAHEKAVPVEVFVEDILACLSIVVSLRRQLDDFELALLDLGRERQVPNVMLGQPLGRLDQHATWKARRRLRNSSSGGRHEVVGYHLHGSTAPDPKQDDPESADAAELRALASGLLEHHSSLAEDEDLDSWLRWLHETGVHDQGVPLTRGSIGLLWTVFDDVATVVRDLATGESSSPQLTGGAIAQLLELISAGEALRQRLRAARHSPTPDA